jgi:CubicO group peptidase (beta-lactamase class C family)
MHFSLLTSISVLLYTTKVTSNFLGPRFPPPIYLNNNESIVAESWKNLSSTIDAYLENGRNDVTPLLAGLGNLTFSIGLFSIHDPAAQSLQYHYTSQEVTEGKGVDKVDGHSIYRLASISKLFSVYAGMLVLSDEQWDQPITDFVPNLPKSALGKPNDDSIHSIRWEDVTLRALASQISGIPRDAQPWILDLGVSPDSVTGVPNTNPIDLGMPPLLNPNDPAVQAPCFTELFATDPLAGCPSELYFEGIEGRAPIFEPWTTPEYTDTGFVLLGIALANITGKPLAQVYPDEIFGPLGMTGARAEAPPESEWSQYVIPAGGEDAWSAQGGISISSGGLLGSLNDLAKFGTALLNSTLLPAAKTRQWMKPVSHSAQFEFSMGTPWEIYRYTHPDTSAVTDIYTKLGDSGQFTGFVCLIPDYNAGFNVITAGSNNSQKSILASTIADLITINILPALEAQAAAEVAHNFAGTYGSTTPGLNSSITFTFNNTPTAPGLYITAWTSNSTDMMPLLPILLGENLKLQPSISQSGQAAFLAVPVRETQAFLGPFQRMKVMDPDWLYGEAVTYGGIGMAQFVFDVDEMGRASGVSHLATRATLSRVE